MTAPLSSKAIDFEVVWRFLVDNLVGVRLRTERVKRGFTQAELAKLVGSSQRTIWLIENGHIPRKSTLSKIEVTLGLPDGFLLGNAKERHLYATSEIILGERGDDPEVIIRLNEIVDKVSQIFAGSEVTAYTKEKFIKGLLKAYYGNASERSQ